MKNLTDFRKTVETGVDPRLATFLNFLRCKSKTRKLLFETQMIAIKLGWDSHSRGIYFISVFS